MVSEPEDKQFDLLPALKIYYGDRLHSDILSIHLERNDKGSIKLVIKDLEEEIFEFYEEDFGYDPEYEAVGDYRIFEVKSSLKNNAIEFLYNGDIWKAMMIYPFFSEKYANEVTKDT